MDRKKQKKTDGSKPLENIRHEKFCQLYAGRCWGNAAKAYKYVYNIKADNRDNVASSAACRILSNFPSVQERVRYLRDQNYKAIEMDREEILQILSEIARGKIQTFVSKDGKISIHGKPNEHAVESVEVVEYLDGDTPRKVRKIKLSSRVEAIDKLCKILGLDSPQKVELTGSVLVIQ